MANANEIPDFIELDMTPAQAVADASDDNGIDLELDALPVAEPVSEAQAMLDARDDGNPQPPAPDFADIAAESSANASVASAGSLNAGSMAYVGFTTAEGYVTALAHGVKQATADSYKSTLRSRYGYTDEQIAALTVSIIPESDLPVGPGIVHMPTGPSIFDLPRAQRTGLPVAQAEPATPAVVAAITPGTLIANLLRDRNGKIFSTGRADRRATHRSRAELVAALATVERTDLAPRIKTNKAQFGEVMRGLNAPGLRMRAWNVTRRDVQKQGQEWPEDLASRWCVGVLDGTDALGSLGEKVLIADLLETNEIRFTGGNDAMRQKVSEAFTARIGDQVYNATDLLNWFRRVMLEEFHAVYLAGMIFVPGNVEATAPVCGMIRALKPVMSRQIVEIDAVTGEGLLAGLAEGLQDEIQEIQDAYDLACDLARKRDRAKVLKATPNAAEADLELAERRAKVLPEAAGSLLRRINEKTDKVNGYETMLGSDVIKPVRDMIKSLRETIEPLCDSTSAMAANIELS